MSMPFSFIVCNGHIEAINFFFLPIWQGFNVFYSLKEILNVGVTISVSGPWSTIVLSSCN